MSRRTAGGIALAAVAALAVAGCASGPIGQDTPQSSGQSFVSGSGTNLYKTGSRPLAPDISGTTLTGQHLSLASYRGSVVVLNFWGSWCGPCRAEAPDLAALATHFRSRGVRFLGIDIRDDPTGADAFDKTFQVTYPSLNDPGDELALDFRGTVPPAGIPTTLVIDRSGRIAARVVGSVSYNGLKALITPVAAEHPVTTGGAAR
ncbi:MAG TPA: TlpA disulfide reductase family protein [Streptosporangiaceae bacterium]|nr:TlpA disulfide reductase family protein [Streptosporangiaceae bacterium]